MPDTPSITVKSLSTDIRWLSIDQKSNADILSQLEQFKAGDFSSIPSGPFSRAAALRFVGVTEPLMERSATNAINLISKDFGGDAKAGLQFLDEIKKTNLGTMDFNELVEKGDAHKLIELKSRDPEAFAAIANGKYNSPQDLENAINAIPVEPGGKHAPVPASAPHSDAPVPAAEKQAAYHGHGMNRHALSVELSKIAVVGAAAVGVEKVIAAEMKPQKQQVAQAEIKSAPVRKLTSAFSV